MSAKAKEKQRYGVQVVYFGEIDRDLDATLHVIAGRPGSYVGHSSAFSDQHGRRDLFWPCYDKAEAAELANRIPRGLFERGKSATVAVKTEEQHWDEKIKAALGNGLVAP